MLHSLYTFPVLVGYLLARIFRKPYGVWPHGVLAPFQRTVSVRKKWLYNKLFVDRILRDSSVIFFSAEGEREETKGLKLRAPSVIIPDGFDASAFSELPERGGFRRRFLNGHSGPLVLFLARLNAKKGLDLLIKAMERVIEVRPDARLAIVGPPDPVSYQKQILRWIKESRIEAQTVLTGAADTQMRLEAFTDSDVYVLPSHAENFGLSVFEAMACGVPVIVSESLNFAAEFARSGAGLTLPREVDAFAAAIQKLISDPDLRLQMGNAGRQMARRYSLEATGEKVLNSIQSIVHGQRLPTELAPRMSSEV
jgi:glycosyltransferase involved in cell wall biosynthesis